MCNTIAGMDLEVVIAVVDEEDEDNALIVGVDDASADVDGKLAGKSASWGHMAIHWGQGPIYPVGTL